MALGVAIAVAFADSSIVVLALPDLYARFATSIVGVSWVITSYNLVVAVGAALLVGMRRLAPGNLSRIGLTLFAAGALGCAVSRSLPALIVFRCLQGAGAAMLLVGVLGLLSALRGSPGRGLAVWIWAATLGAAVGPALGGVVTELFDWRAIFIFQVPVGLVGLMAAFQSSSHPAAGRRGPPLVAANLAQALVFGALVGALFLAVLLMITVWGFSPIAGAAVVTALPLGTVAARRVARELAPGTAAIAGVLLLAAGLLALALLPATTTSVVVVALALCGLGMGLAVPVLTELAVRPGPGLAHDGTVSVVARHAGLVVALVLVAPLLSSDLQAGGRDAMLGGTKVLLNSDVPIRRLVPIALDLGRTVQHAPRGTVPNLAQTFDRHGAARDPRLGRLRDSVTGAIQDALTRSFRNSLALCALLAALAAVPILIALRRSRR